MNNQPLTTAAIGPLVDRLRHYNQWRRGLDAPQPSPEQIGTDIDTALALLITMRDAITATIDENGHLADGDDCTLHHLVRITSTNPRR